MTEKLYKIADNRALLRIEPHFDGISTAVTNYEVVDQTGTLQYIGDKSECKHFMKQLPYSFISDVEKLINDILKYFPKYFDDFKNFEYWNGSDAGKDFKKIFNKAKRLNNLNINEQIKAK